MCFSYSLNALKKADLSRRYAPGSNTKNTRFEGQEKDSPVTWAFRLTSDLMRGNISPFGFA